jgi:hypothetical protein
MLTNRANARTKTPITNKIIITLKLPGISTLVTGYVATSDVSTAAAAGAAG